MKNYIIVILILVIGLASCNSGGDNLKLNSPTFGKVKIVADESLSNIIEQEINAFEGIYHNADIQIVYLPEQQAINYLLADSAKLAILTRALTPEEESVLKDQSIYSETNKIAYDGIAIVVNSENPDSTFSSNDISAILSGKVRVWSGLKENGLQDSIRIIFDNNESGIVRYMKDSVSESRRISGNSFAVKNAQEVINFVKEYKNSIGFVGVNWLSDDSHAAHFNLPQEVKVAAVSKEQNELAYKPYQAYIAQKTYPLIRPVYAVSREGRSGLASGFTAFMASERGQRVILKTGLVPVTMPLRIVQMPDSTISN